MLTLVEGGAAPDTRDQPSLATLGGSKRQLVPTLARYWEPGYSRYVEPFAGSARLFFHLAPPRALLGDINADLIATYAQLRKSGAAVHRALKALESGRRAYKDLRKADPSSLAGPARAARFIYLNHYCFNGLYRTNRLGQFNVPYGGDKTGPLPGSRSLNSTRRSCGGPR